MSRFILAPLFVSLLFLGCEPETEVEDPGDGGQTEDLGNGGEADFGADDAGMTGQCETNDDCPADARLCTDEGACVECLDNRYCPTVRPVCNDIGTCRECLDNTYCPALQPICTEEQTCTDVGQGVCREDFDCENVATPICLRLMGGRIGVCVECLSEADCIQSRPICSTAGRCVADEADATCTADAECGPPRLCEAGTCIEREVE